MEIRDRDAPGIGKSWRRARWWIYTSLLTLLLVTNVLINFGFFFPPASARKVFYGDAFFILPDSTNGVVLAGGTVSFTPDFTALYNEAFCSRGAHFQVPQGTRRLVVYCDKGMIVSTRRAVFDVKPVAGDSSKMQVLVGEGTVEITDLTGRSYGRYTAGQEATVDLLTQAVARKQYREVFISDRNVTPVLRFERLPLAEVAAQLKDHFAVDIRVTAAVREYLIDATFPVNISLFQALEMLELSNQDKRLKYTVTPDGHGGISQIILDRR
ncbi:DUF4974 domain-containing protein [Dawidia soli]|uniref:Protein FecR C-terminal domain-containing protein n=1 Tax=Dawidia soli TaxID=2782352 RepID=A0AAP2GKU5_9BACT|nr:DUF4974 domain-containing protein [Dawidia soli]MBT1690831.1 hypothetical protein [Dawidia soli]